MKCSLNTFVALISAAIACLVGAVALAAFWGTALPLFGAAALVASVSYYFIPQIKNEILAYVACRGPSKCEPPTVAIDNLGQAAVILGIGSFLAAGLLQLTALAFISSWLFSVIGWGMEFLVAKFVESGVIACGAVAIILGGILTSVLGYRDCMNQLTASGQKTSSSGALGS